ncbi:MAG: YggS family pyridoxal phosphate-dependent enzyme [Kiritimatiellae bacterium]|nr:YggS family pyridoxal phosphate-dependent enzyme [Kiritimatiellia bacterium]
MTSRAEEIAQNLAAVQTRIRRACEAAGRNPVSVRLLAVSKTYPPEDVTACADAGQLLFGENRVQEAIAKMPLCPGRLQWHLIGHLQSNKAAHAVESFDYIHSVDSLALLQRLDRLAVERGRRPTVLLEVNVSGEKSKSGMPPDQLAATLAAVPGLQALTVAGLMTVPPIAADPEEARPYFRELRRLRDEAQAATDLALPELSMGMTHDFEVAIAEGATFVRIGTAIFGPRPPMVPRLES